MQQFNKFILDIIELNVVAFIVNYLIGFIFCYVAIKIKAPKFDVMVSCIKSLLANKEKTSDRQEEPYGFKTRQSYMDKIFYCFAGGLITAVLVYHQFNRVDILTSAIYGLLGPYALIDKIMNLYASNNIGSLNKAFSQRLSPIDPDKEYEETLGKTVRLVTIPGRISSVDPNKGYEETLGRTARLTTIPGRISSVDPNKGYEETLGRTAKLITIPRRISSIDPNMEYEGYLDELLNAA